MAKPKVWLVTYMTNVYGTIQYMTTSITTRKTGKALLHEILDTGSKFAKQYKKDDDTAIVLTLQCLGTDKYQREVSE